MADDYDDRSADQIRRDIEGTRADMHETVEALERKLSVGQLVDEVWGRMGGGRSAVAAAGARSEHSGRACEKQHLENPSFLGCHVWGFRYYARPGAANVAFLPQTAA